MSEIVELAGADAGEWSVVNDDVMGGRSTSDVERTDDGTLRFHGHVSLENNGGFASVRTDIGPVDLSSFRGVALRVRGDGRRYQLRLRVAGRWSRIWYKATFETVDDEWIEVRHPFSDFEPTFRGRRPPDAPPLDPSAVRQVGVLIADEREGPFTLEVDRIRPYDGDG